VTSERIQRRIDSLLDEADAAAGRNDWETVRDRSDAVLAFDPDNADAKHYLEAALRRIQIAETEAASAEAAGTAGALSAPEPASFAGGRYQVKRFLGEGGRKKVFLAHDTRLDREVAIAVIKTEAWTRTDSNG
jgi:hypothetical protein